MPTREQMKNPEYRRKYDKAWRDRHKKEEVNGHFSLDYAMTHEAIGQRLGLTRARVWQIEQTAIAKLRERFALLGITRLEHVSLNETGIVEPDWNV